MKLLIVLLAVVSLAHGEMRRIWEVQLSKKIKEPAGWPQMKYHALQSLAFSPDSKWLAVTIDDHQTTTTIGTHVLVVDLSAPPGSMKQYDVDACGAPIEWAPDGHAILVCTLAVVKLKSGETCTAIEPPPANLRPPLMRGALSSARWLDSRRILRNSANGVSVLDEDCAMQPTGRDDMTAAGDETRKIPPGWPPVELKEYKMINASRTPPRVLADRWSDSLPAHFDIEPAPTVRRRVVWDLSDKREIASWKPHEGRPYNQLFYVHPYQDCTLSPDGHLVAEGGNGVVRLYRLD
jgi:hypothetical protein